MRNYLLALDQGTSSSRALLFDDCGQIVALHAEPFECLYPQPGWVEQDPQLLWLSQQRALLGVLSKAGLRPREVHAIGITNQRETLIAWHRDTGEPIYNAIVWQCRRSAAYCDELKRLGFEGELRARTGLLADPYFSATKMRWLLQNVPEARTLAARGKLAFGTVDAWLIWKLTGGRRHATDASNASRTLLYNIFEQDWDDTLLRQFDIPRETLPEVLASSGFIAYTDPSVFGAEVPIAGVAGDQQAALFGHACFKPGMAKNTYGTGCFMLMNSGTDAALSQHGLLTTIAWKLGNDTIYALEGAVFVAGALIQWLRDQLGLIEDAAESERLALTIENTGGVYIVPAFVGLGAPHWNAEARGLICGLTRGSGKAQIARAALEAVAYQNFDLLQSMRADTGIELKSLRIDGGMCVNNFLCQFQADILGLAVIRPRIVETTALGAAFLAGLATGVWQSQDELAALWQEERRFEPTMADSVRQPLLDGWRDAVARTRGGSNARA